MDGECFVCLQKAHVLAAADAFRQENACCLDSWLRLKMEVSQADRKAFFESQCVLGVGPSALGRQLRRRRRQRR